MCAAEQTDLYAVLGAHPSDSVQQLRRQYQQLALQFHPDRVGGQRSSTAESALSRFLEVDAAWKILSDQKTRREYDSQRRAEALKQDWPVDSTVHLEDMSFDPDDRMFVCDCRCGGGFSISEQEVEETQQEDGNEGTCRSVLVCCDTCSLSVCVTWTSNWKAQLHGT
uniref:DnaJ (Hsp40) homolog, subfamily C, member 24 n=1 Tax=Oryzias latipes TaxID=8090 RepID=A0A3P9ICS1_ORYLA